MSTGRPRPVAGQRSCDGRSDDQWDSGPYRHASAQVADDGGGGWPPPDGGCRGRCGRCSRDYAAAGGMAEVATVNMSPVIVVVTVSAPMGCRSRGVRTTGVAQRHSDLRFAAAARPTGRFRHRTQTPLAESDAARPSNVCSTTPRPATSTWWPWRPPMHGTVRPRIRLHGAERVRVRRMSPRRHWPARGWVGRRTTPR